MNYYDKQRWRKAIQESARKAASQSFRPIAAWIRRALFSAGRLK